MRLPDVDRFRDRDWSEPDGGTIRLALVGLGEFTTGWVAPSADDSDYAAVGAVASGSPEKAERVATAHDARALSYEELLAGDDADAYDAVYVSTPNATHLEYARAAAEQGKAVLCEKPMEATLDRAGELVEACADVPLMVAYRLHVDPAVRWARAVVREGLIGDPVHVRGSMGQDVFEAISPDPDQWRLNHDLSGGAALIDLGIYPLNTTRFLTGSDPVEGSAVTRSPDDAFEEVDEHVGFTVRYEDDLLGSFTASQYSARSDHLHLTGTDGELVLSPAFFGHVDVGLTVDGVTHDVTFPEGNEMREQLDYFASCVLRGETPEPDGEHGLVDTAAIEGLYEAAESGETVEF